MTKLENTIAWLKDFRDYFRERTRPGYNIEFHGCNVVEKLDEVLELLKDDETQLQYRDEVIYEEEKETARLRKLLKEREPVKPFIRIHDANISNGTELVCGHCNGSFLHQHVKFCPWCGRAVK